MSSQISELPVPPGVVINHFPSRNGNYVGSPSLAILPDGTYVASHDQFGPGSSEHINGRTFVYHSRDRGASWEPLAKLENMFWGGLFVHAGLLYILGTTFHHGLVVIRRSEDGGRTWTTPVDEHTGLLTPAGQFHTAPVPVIEQNGFLWRAVEDAGNGPNWGERYSPMMISAPAGEDLLFRKNWRFSNTLPHSRSWLGGRFRAWLEGNAVPTPDGGVANLLRVDYSPGGKAALAQVAPSGDRLDFEPEAGFMDFPGGATKFSVRYDPSTRCYWSLVNDTPDWDSEDNAALVRNTLSLSCSKDLRSWTVVRRLVHHPDRQDHGFQYADWLFDGEDIVATVRTAYDDADGGAHSAHDANYLTFHRFESFRQSTIQ